MSDEETRLKRSQKRKRNIYARVVKENKLFRPKVIDKPRYKRTRIDLKDVDEESEDEVKLRQIERILDDQLIDKSFEEFLEEFDLTPFDVFSLVYEHGLIDDEILKQYLPSDGV